MAFSFNPAGSKPAASTGGFGGFAGFGAAASKPAATGGFGALSLCAWLCWMAFVVACALTGLICSAARRRVRCQHGRG